MSSPPSPNDLTRHQLDELDALLQRMLSVPAGTPSPGTGPTVPELPPLPASGSWRSDTAGLPSRSPYVAAEPVPTLQPAVSRATTVPMWGPDPLARYSPQMPAPTVEVVCDKAESVLAETVPLASPALIVSAISSFI